MTTAVVASGIGVWIGDQGVLSVEELALACGAEPQWIIELVDIGMLSPESHSDIGWRFSAADLARARKVRRLTHDFNASIEAAAVIIELLEETERLRSRLRQAGLATD